MQSGNSPWQAVAFLSVTKVHEHDLERLRGEAYQTPPMNRCQRIAKIAINKW